MSFDALAAHAIHDELSASLIGGQIQQIVLVGSLGIGLTVYAQRARRYVLLSADPGAARVHLVSAPLKRESEAVTPLLLLLRKYVRDGRIVGVEQPYLERVLEFQVAKRHDGGDLKRVRLIIEAMGRRSNVALVDEDGSILDVLKRASPSRNPGRPLLPHLRYTYPPAQQRLDPLAESTLPRLRDEAAQRRGDLLADLLASRLAGFSPELSREAVWRSSEALDTPAGGFTDWPRLRAVLDELLAGLRGGSWQPTVAMRHGRPVAFAAYPLTHIQDAEPRCCTSISEAVEAYYAQPPSEAIGAPDSLEVRAHPQIALEVRSLQRSIEARLAQLARKKEALQRTLDQAGEADSLRAAGEAILASLASIQPGQSELPWDGARYALDPELSALENAERYFRDYRKAQDARARLPALLSEVERDRAYLQETAVFLNHAADHAQLKTLRAELSDLGLSVEKRELGRPARKQQTQQRRQAPKVRRVTTADGFEILVGMSAAANEELTFRTAEPDDLWIHARGQPGAHVIVRAGGRSVPDAVVEQAARLASAYSGAAASGRVEVDYTRRRYVRKLRGGRPGQVTYSHEQTLAVQPLRPTDGDEA